MTSRLVSDDRAPGEASATGVTVCALVAAHAAARPDGTAVVDARGRVSFAELQDRSGRLAARLRASGVGPGSCVALFLDRSVEFVVAALAVMRAGAAYLPLETSSPADRLAFVLADAGVAVVVARTGQEPPAGPRVVVDVTDRPGPALDADAPAPDDLAYVIYTSGSTGRPKGVELTHANLANLVAWHVAAFGITPADRASQLASVGFDAAVWEVWPHLAAGAAVHVVDEVTRTAPVLLRDRLVADGITIAFTPPVLAEQLVQLPWPDGTALRTLLTGADVLHRRPPPGLPFALVNNYGPTECTVVATSGTVAPGGGSAPTIGRPISGATALVLDEALAPVADGEPGELCVGGALVGRGYRNDPGLTAQRFVVLPGVGRVYRTGDRVRLLPGGELAFLGRLDQQIKLRGYRIEPAEVVGALLEEPAVSAAAVVARPGPDGEAELVAYVVRAAPVTDDALRAHLGTRLPDYLVPARFVGVDALPVTVNGKLDEAALPAPEAAAAPAGGGVQAEISAMVCELLTLPAIDPADNIFLVGGHSMLAMQIAARIKQAFGVRLSLRQVFEQPTVAGLAAAVAERTGGPA